MFGGPSVGSWIIFKTVRRGTLKKNFPNKKSLKHKRTSRQCIKPAEFIF